MSQPEFPAPEELCFRTLAAPGLDEDEIFAAMHGLPGNGGLWGASMPTAFAPTDQRWSAGEERGRRHRDLMDRWQPLPDESSPEG